MECYVTLLNHERKLILFLKTASISIIVLCFSVIIFLMIPQSTTYAILPLPSQVKYFNSDIVLIGKITSVNQVLPNTMKYEIQVEQYLKNPQSQDKITAIAPGINKTLIEELGTTSDTLFDVGDRALLYLKNDQGNYMIWWFSHHTDSLCRPAPSQKDLNFEYPKGLGFADLPAYSPLHVGASQSNSYRYSVNQPVVLSYDAWNDHFTAKNLAVEFNVKSLPDSRLVFHDIKYVDLKPCIGHQTVSTSFVPKTNGTYEIDAVFDQTLTGTTIDIPKNAGNAKMFGSYPLAPLRQLKSGGLPDDVKCSEDRVLIKKLSTNSVVCLRPHTASKVTLRGWVLSGINNQQISSNQNYNPTQINDIYFKLGPDPFGPIPHRLVFFMKSDSTAKIFVEYTSELPNTGTMKSLSTVYVGKTNYTPFNSSKVTITADSPSISLTQGSKTVVVYTITAKEEASGIYWISLAQICGVMPIAIDRANFSVGLSEIPVPSGTMHCPAQLLNAKILGISGGLAEYKLAAPLP